MMSFEMRRRRFLAAGLAGLAAPLSSQPGADSAPGLKLGVATYSLRKLSRTQAIACIRELHTPYISVKSYHLPYDSTPRELAEGRREFERAGLKIMSGGNIPLQSDDPAVLRGFFEYARMCGMPMMVCAPTHRNLGAIEKLVQEYNIRIAIHNHGPEDPQFPTPQSVLAVVRNMDPRCGLCLDVGHAARAGANVVESVAQAGGRLFDMHMKDLRTFDAHAVQCDVGEGIMPVVGIFKQLEKMGYPGCVNLEYEIHPDNPLPGMKNSFSYMRGVLAGLKG
jgi:sugar phosphate isomerase/epimerase